jgi:hypothetical protein
VLNTKNAQIELHKSKLYNRRSLAKGGSILTIDSLKKLKLLARKDANDAVDKQKRKIQKYKSKAKRLRHEAGVRARREEKAWLKFLSDNQGILGVYIPIASQEPIRDPEKNPLLEELEIVYIRSIGLYKELARLKAEAERVKSDDPKVFTTILINPKILKMEHKFKMAQKKGISQVLVAVDKVEEEDSDNEDSEGSSVGDNNIISPPRSVVSIDSIQENADFIQILE